MAIKLTSDQTSQIINFMQGTCITLNDGCNRLFNVDYWDLHMDIIEEIDHNIFCCEGCGWWCDVGEMSDLNVDETLCQDCEGDWDE